MQRKSIGLGLGRRQFLQLTAAGLFYLAASRERALAAQYVVGVGKQADAYVATSRAIDATGEWTPSLISGRKVLIKPNLVAAFSASTGTTTDPQVVRAIVDKALAAGAAQVRIVEGYPGGNNFASCGYDFFNTYDPAGRVSLVNLNALPYQLVNVPGGLAYHQLYLPDMLREPDTLLVSAAKMKVHAETMVTLSVKNVFGLPPEERYRVAQPGAVGRFAMHDRGVHQAIIDLNLVRPVDFAVVDGIWAMEGTGPWGGAPIRMDTVIAGKNAVAVDRVCLSAMGIPQHWVHHLLYASYKGLGAPNVASIEMRGDTLAPKKFKLPDVPSIVNIPIANPTAFAPGQGQNTTIAYWINQPSWTRADIIQTSETSTVVTQTRLLKDWTLRPTGITTLSWDGRDNQGNIVVPGQYTMRVEAHHGQPARNAFATGWVSVL